MHRRVPLAGTTLLAALAALGALPRAAAQNASDLAGRERAGGRVQPRPWDDWVAPYVDSTWTAFAADLLAWAVIAAFVVLVAVPLLKWLSHRVPGDADDRMVAIVSGPAFLLVFAFGIVDSLRQFGLSPGLARGLEQAWTVLLILTLTVVAYRVWHQVIRGVGHRVSRRTASRVDDKLFPIFDKAGGVLIVLAGIWITVDSFGIDMTLFAAGGAIGGLVIAFAAQDSLANFFAGVQILLDQPFREGDRIEIQEENTWGDVVEVGLRSTRIRTRDNRIVVVPNSLIGNNAVINHSFPDTSYRLTAELGIAYGSDVEKARRAMVEAVAGVDGVDGAREAQALFMAFGQSSLDFHVRYWIDSYEDTRLIQDRVHTALEARLRAEGIEIPFPQRVLWNGAKPAEPAEPVVAG